MEQPDTQRITDKGLGVLFETQVSRSVLPSIVLPWLSLTHGGETWSLTMHR